MYSQVWIDAPGTNGTLDEIAERFCIRDFPVVDTDEEAWRLADWEDDDWEDDEVNSPSD